MATHSKFIQSESEFQVENGKFVEADLGGKVVARMDKLSGDFIAKNINETFDATQAIGWHVNEDGQRWWTDPDNQAFGTERTGGTSPWSIYKQTNIFTTARKYAGKDSLYGVHIFRYPNISSSSTWGGLRLYPPADAKIRGHKYRFSFDYRGNTGGASLDVYQNYEIGWGNMGIGLPGAWGRSLGAFDTDWQWQRYEQEFEIQDELLDFIPGSNQVVWDPNTSYTGYRGIQYNGYVYRVRSGVYTTKGVTPEDEYNSGNGVYNWKIPMTPGYLDIYKQIKIGFTYNTQGARGTHVYIDNIQITDITTNQRWKFNGDGWEADNLSDATLHIKAVGTAYNSLFQNGDQAQPDIFEVHGNRILEVNGTQIYSTSGRGLRLTKMNSKGTVTLDTLYDTYGSDSARQQLADQLANMGSSEYWVLTSYDAISNANGGTPLHNQLVNMGSKMWDTNESLYYVGYYRSTYAAVGYGSKIIKEDGGYYSDSVYKRKAVIDLKL